MNPFAYVQAHDLRAAVSGLAADPAAKVIAGGTNLIDLMKENVEKPRRLIGIGRVGLDDIHATPDGGLRIGALVTNSAVAHHPEVERRYPLLSKAILAGASPQLRNMASVGGNLMQRTRCSYFYDTATACNKREPGGGCAALNGFNEYHAILGASEHCIATHPSDMCVALAALEATARVIGRGGERAIPFRAFHRLPGDTPHLDTNVRRDEIITAVDLPPKGFAEHSTYIKVRERTSYAFALVSVAAALAMDGAKIVEARIALGGVAHKPWRDPDVDAGLSGQPATSEAFTRVADLLLRDARGYGHNDFKIELAKRVVVRALTEAAAGGART